MFFSMHVFQVRNEICVRAFESHRKEKVSAGNYLNN